MTLSFKTQVMYRHTYLMHHFKQVHVVLLWHVIVTTLVHGVNKWLPLTVWGIPQAYKCFF